MVSCVFIFVITTWTWMTFKWVLFDDFDLMLLQVLFIFNVLFFVFNYFVGFISKLNKND